MATTGATAATVVAAAAAEIIEATAAPARFVAWWRASCWVCFPREKNPIMSITLSDPHQHFNHLSSCPGEEHVATVVSFVVLDFACGSSGCVLWLRVVVVCCG